MSTSGKNILYILSSLLLGFALIEVGFRIFVPKRSSNMRTITSLKQAPAYSAAQKEIVILGNSFTLCGIAPKELQQELRELNQEIRCTVHALSGSQICEWYWMAALHVLNQSPPPAELILNTGPISLKDQSTVRHRRLALIFGEKGPFLPKDHLRGQSKEIEFTLARALLSVNRGRNIGALMATKILPGHKTYQASLTKSAMPPPQTDPSSDATYTIFKSLHQACESAGVTLKIVLMPHREIYSMDPEWLNLARELQIEIIDGQLSQNRDDFDDAVHLNKKGRKWFTRAYADLIGGTTPAE